MIRRASFTIVLFLIVGVAQSNAQPGRVDVKAAAAVGQFYLDESFPDHFELGASARIHLGSRWAIEPEFSYVDSNVDFLPDEWNYVFVTNVVRHFGDREARAKPYWLVGGGVRFGGNAENVFVATGGIGVDVELSQRLFVFAEARGPAIRVAGGLGFAIGPTE